MSIRRFILHVLTFTCALLASWYVLDSLSRLINTKVYNKFYSGNETLILGDSHVKYLNEEIIDNSLNLYRGGQSYKESFYKLKYFDKINDFDDLILACSYHNFSHLAEDKINHDYHSIHSISTLAPLSDLFESTKSKSAFFSILFKHFSINRFKQYVQDILGRSVDLKSEVDVNIIYKPFAEIKRKSKHKNLGKNWTKKRINKHYFFENVTDSISKSSVLYFSKILEYCQKNDIKVYLVNMPLHPDYQIAVPKYYKNKFKKIISEHSKDYSFELISYVDFFEDKLHLFVDADHCSEYGGALLSKELKNQITKQR